MTAQASLSFATINLGAERFRLYQADAVEWLRGLPDASVDLIITDPPYESLEKHRKVGTTTRLKHSKASSNDWFPIFPNDRFPELFHECFRVLKKDRHFYLFCDPETMFVVKPMAETAGFKFWKPLVWWKISIGMGYHYRASYEAILFFEKGHRNLADLAIPDVIAQRSLRLRRQCTCEEVPICRDDQPEPDASTQRGTGRPFPSASRVTSRQSSSASARVVSRVCGRCGLSLGAYPTQKPGEVARLLTYQSAEKGYLVADPFMGSGSFGVAALHEDCRFVGCDIAEKAVALARSRLDPLEDLDRFEHPEDPPGAANMIEIPEGADMKSELVDRGLVKADAWKGKGGK